MSEIALKVQAFYKEGSWNITRVFNVVGKPNSITQAEYQTITGFVYPNKA